VELSPVGIFSSTVEGRFLVVNSAFARMLGYGSPAELLRLDIPGEVYFDRADREKIVSRYEQAEGIVRIEALLKKKDGSPLPVWFDGRVVRDARGRTLGFEGFVHDLSERRSADEALRRGEERFRALVENSQEVTGLVDREGRWLYVSPSVRRLLGFEPEEILALGRFGARVHPEDLVLMRERFRELVEGADGPSSLEFRARRKDGSWGFFEVVGANRLNDPNIGAVVLNYRDITDRKRATEALRRSEERFRALVENSYEVVCLFDREERWIYVSPSVFRIWGYTPEEMLATRALGERIHPDDVEGVLTSFRALAKTPEAVYRMEFRARHKDGSWRDVEAVGVNRFDEPSIGAIVANLRDISERKRSEERLKQSHEMIRALAARIETVREEESSRIARELHDEIGQALTAIKIQLQTLSRSPQASTFHRELDEGIGIAERALEAARNLSLDLRPSVLDDLGLPAALRWYLDRQATLSGFAAEFSANLRNERLSRELETACFRVVQEAVTNVIRHARARRVRVDLAQDGAALLLAIQDDGVGFDVAAAQARARGGRSLGILGMEERVSQLGGSLEIDSAPSEGTRICARLPVQPAAAPSGSR
jgi:PAS domain S-box-containing protein